MGRTTETIRFVEIQMRRMGSNAKRARWETEVKIKTHNMLHGTYRRNPTYWTFWKPQLKQKDVRQKVLWEKQGTVII